MSTDVFASVSHDGRWVYFASSRAHTQSVWKMPVAGGDAVRVSPTDGLLGIESSDGAYLYYVESVTSNAPGALWQLPLKGGQRTKLADGVLSLSFAVTDGGIYYVDHVSGQSRINYVDFAARRSTLIAENLGNLVPGITASRDGRTILFSRVDTSVNDLMLVENFR